MKSSLIEKIFVIHYESLKDRKEYLDRILPLFKIPFEYIISNKELDSKLDISKYYDFNKNLSEPNIFVTIRHFEVYEKIFKEGIKYALILEDDAILKDDGMSMLDNIVEHLASTEFDICFISDCCDLHADDIEESRLIYEAKTSRCNCAYIVNCDIIPTLLKTLPFSEPIDWHLNIIKENIDIRYYWSEPTVFRQGSEKEYESNIRNNRLN